MLNAIRKNGLTLAIFACASTGLVAVTHYLTKDQIKQQEQAQLLSVLNQVIPHEKHDNELVFVLYTWLSLKRWAASKPCPLTLQPSMVNRVRLLLRPLRPMVITVRLK